MLIIDIITILGGIVLIVAPKWAYNFGRQEYKEMPEKWNLISRILGGVFILLGIFFLVNTLSSGGSTLL